MRTLARNLALLALVVAAKLAARVVKLCLNGVARLCDGMPSVAPANAPAPAVTDRPARRVRIYDAPVPPDYGDFADFINGMRL